METLEHGAPLWHLMILGPLHYIETVSLEEDLFGGRRLTRAATGRTGMKAIALGLMRICPESVRVWSPRAAMMLRSAKKALLPVRPATRSRISNSVTPPNRRNSSLVTTDISLGAPESFSENLDAVVTLMFDSASRSIENTRLAPPCGWGPSGGCWPKPAVAVNHSAARPVNRNRLLAT